MVEEQTARGFLFVGGHLCLDFVNTEVMESGSRVDRFGDFADVAAWCVDAHVIDAAQAKALRRRGLGARQAERAFTAAIELRAALREMAERIVDGRKAADQAILNRINDVLRVRTGDLTLVRTDEGYETRFRPRVEEPGQLLVPIAESAADLLSHGNPALVRKCQNPGCILYFYDTTKNHARRWCSMTACGNRAKAAAHYRRARQARVSRASQHAWGSEPGVR